MRCVESGVQSGRYLAPRSRAFSLSSPLKGFWKPLRTNTTPSMIRLNGTCCALWDLVFCCLGFGSGFLSADFWAGDAWDKQTKTFLDEHETWRFRYGGGRYLFRWTGSACWLGSAWRLWPQVSQLGSFSLRVEVQRRTAALYWTQISFLLVAVRKIIIIDFALFMKSKMWNCSLKTFYWKSWMLIENCSKLLTLWFLFLKGHLSKKIIINYFFKNVHLLNGPWFWQHTRLTFKLLKLL